MARAGRGNGAARAAAGGRARRHALRYRGALRLRPQRGARRRDRCSRSAIASFSPASAASTGVHGKRVIDGRPETLKHTCHESLQRLRTDVIDLYYLHRWDKKVPIEESIGALGELVRAGHVRAIGLSEVSAATLRRRTQCIRSAAVQSEYSLWTRNPEIALLDACQRAGRRVRRVLAARPRISGGRDARIPRAASRRTSVAACRAFSSRTSTRNLRLLDRRSGTSRARRAARALSSRSPGCCRKRRMSLRSSARRSSAHLRGESSPPQACARPTAAPAARAPDQRLDRERRALFRRRHRRRSIPRR